jgi:hypothetical protein
MRTSKKYPIHWVQFISRRRKVFLGICGRTARPFTVASKRGLELLIVNDLYVDEEKQDCEEEERCLNTACPLNRTTQQSLATQMLGLKRIPKWLRETGVRPVNIAPEEVEFLDDLCQRHPDRGVVVMSRQKTGLNAGENGDAA